MKKRYLLFLFCTVMIFSCGENEPSNILSRDQMVGILIRLHMAEAKAGNSYLIHDTLKIYYKTLEDSIFSKYKTDSKTFEASYKYWMENPTAIDKIYAQVVDSLSLREAIKKVD